MISLKCKVQNSNWYARELQSLLGYERWENFANAIEKAKIACEISKQGVLDHFRDVTKTIPMPKEASKEIPDIMLTRYGCYLIAQNGDPRKDEIAFAMTYFAVQKHPRGFRQKWNSTGIFAAGRRYKKVGAKIKIRR